MAVDRGEIESILGRERSLGSVVFALGADTPELPPRWGDVLMLPEARERAAAALRLWNPDFLDLIPNFARMLRTELADARVVRLHGELAMVYALEHHEPGRRVICWIGWDPASFGAGEPEHWTCVPRPMRTFLSQVHAGFTAPDRLSFGPRRPRSMRTLAELARHPDGIPGWDQDPDSTRLLAVASTYAGLYGCVSCDLSAGAGVLADGANLESPRAFGALLDDILMSRLTEAGED
ncbi:hypothetical protein [Nocardia jejuensis]|uniref:hypothetical protein n=1 Tax=Nocardia jejuensis TaxID=328049 RepID=UPI0008315A08|nr:hypothetical protein [Nocardia jejuensis]